MAKRGGIMIARGSQLAVRGLWLAAGGSRLTARGSQIAAGGRVRRGMFMYDEIKIDSRR